MVTGRREEEERISGGRFVEPAAATLLPPPRVVNLQGIGIDYDQAYHFGANAISGFGNGGMVISDAWIVVGGTRLAVPVKVVPGTSFEVHVAFSANNTAGGWVAAWTVCVTVIDDTRTIYNWKQHNSTLTGPGTIAASNMILNALSDMVMPDRDMVLTIKGFGTDNYQLFGNLTPPPMSLW